MSDKTKDIYGRGWCFPITFTKQGVKMVADQQDIEQSLQILFRTQPGERIMRPHYGCDLQSAVFENISEALFAELRTRIIDSVLQHEPRVIVEDVTFTRASEQPNYLHVQVAYRIRGADSVHRFNGQLDIGNGRAGGFV
ncbi:MULTISPECIES: GPW/gp25 family protein [Mycetohabitans]|uniref:GPW/gp25 family protein n=1 Tax=Mycetohabitans TaxID=2571159 RepID=UPI001F2D43FE|nr:GPW/gp25 family protein [Mycetohabitans sp. B3]MCF2134584.1 GPW/gp25 family protein [Mycetohabitans sp. B3]